uniref:RNA replicase n=1 Tax=Beihai noda-like virus 9 TaxID=1922491 RepID=A0A1L3KFM9_9VIRU|nr:hypothetical protein 1 [Beihai noda-like virus 9]
MSFNMNLVKFILPHVLVEGPGCLTRLRMIQRGVEEFARETITSKRIKIVIGGVTTVYLCHRAYGYFRDVDIRAVAFDTRIGNVVYSWITNKLSTDVCPDNRQQVKGMVMRMTNVQLNNHSHPTAALMRRNANMFMQQACMTLGRRSYNFQLSPTQQRLKSAGFRTIYCAKDLQMAYQNNSLKPEDVIVLTDVDYYVDMNTILRGNPVIIYTFVPLEVAGNTEDGIYCTHSDNTVETVTNGGAKYRHMLWDYDNDHLVIDTWCGSYIYLIEQIMITNTRRIIYFNPVRFVPLLLGWILPGRRLRRRQFNKRGVMYSKFTKTNDEGVVELWHSMAYAGDTPACTVRSDTFQAAYIRLVSNKTPHISDVERYFSTHNVQNTLHAATLFYRIFVKSPEVFGTQPELVTPCVVQRDTHSYQSVDGLVSEDGKPTMRAIWPGYGNGIAFSPVKSYNNDKASLKGRIEDVKNKRYPIPPIYYSYLHEFVQFMVPSNRMGTVTPLSYEEIWEQFCKPTQRAKLAPADFTMDTKATVRSFQKVEAYGKLTAPRNISTLPMGHNAALGQFTIPLMKHIFKMCHWYAFGRHPREVSQNLYMKAQGSASATATDFTKLDGSIQEFFRDGFDMVAFAALAQQYHAEWLRNSKKERNAKCRTTQGLKYDSDNTILSGSSLTSLLGTFVNALTMYISYRTGYGPEESWARLGEYGGDDGVSFDLPAAWTKHVTAKLGLHCKTEETAMGEPVSFLGRIYPDIWTSPASMVDVKRQVAKLHLTGSPKIVPDYLVLFRKAQGYRCTDENTPFLTAWCEAVMRIVQTQHCRDPENHKYWHLTKIDSVYWSKFETPFETFSDVEHLRGIVAEQFGITAAELMEYERKISNAKTLNDLYLTDVIRIPSKVALKVVVGGEVVEPEVKTDIQAEILQAQKLKQSLCRFARRGDKCPYENCKFVHTIARVEPKMKVEGEKGKPIKGKPKKKDEKKDLKSSKGETEKKTKKETNTSAVSSTNFRKPSKEVETKKSVTKKRPAQPKNPQPTNPSQTKTSVLTTVTTPVDKTTDKASVAVAHLKATSAN